MKHWYRTSASSVISDPPCWAANVTLTRVPSGNGSRVSTNIPVSVMLRPIPLATPRSPSRNTGKALSNRPTAPGLGRGGSCLSVRLDIGGRRSAGWMLHGRCGTHYSQGKHPLRVLAVHFSRQSRKRLTLHRRSLDEGPSRRGAHLGSGGSGAGARAAAGDC